MLDINESRIARQEYEQRVQAMIPVPDYDERLKNDRHLSVWPIRNGVEINRPQNRRAAPAKTGLLAMVSNLLNSVSVRLKAYQAAGNEVQLKDHLNRNTSV